MAEEIDKTAVPRPPRRATWAVTFARLAWVAGLFALVLGGLLLFNSVRIYTGGEDEKVRLVEAEQLFFSYCKERGLPT